MIGALTNHLWQSTLFAGVAGLLTLAFRKNRAQVRYLLWLSASLKFFVPFALLMSLGSQLQWAPAVAQKIATPAVSFAVEQIAQPFPDVLVAPAPRSTDWAFIATVAVWACGFLAIVLIRLRAWQRIRAAVRSSVPTELPAEVEIRSSPGLLEPGVVGFLRPVLLLPEGIERGLTPSQLEAVLAHELCHVRRRDNLTSALHMIVEAVFWFHPLVWWIGARLVEERERACDQEVLLFGSEPVVYAEGILNVCKLCVESPLACVSGVTGGSLKRRIKDIMRPVTARRLSIPRKLLLAAAGFAAIAVPVGIGLLNAPRILAQSQAVQGRPEFDVASIKPYASEAAASGFRYLSIARGRLAAEGTTLPGFIDVAYQVWPYQIFGGPDWINSDRYEVTARAEGNPTAAQTRAMVQTMLADRFKLVLHRETKELPIYTLVAAKNGLKLQASKRGDCLVFREGMPIPGISKGPPKPYCGQLNGARGFPELTGEGVTMVQLASRLSAILGRSVIDQTGFTGTFNINLRWTPDEAIEGPLMAPLPAPDPDGPSIFTALQENLGLKLQSGKGPVEILVIDHVDHPSEN